MTDTTVERVVAIAEHLKDMDKASLQLHINDAIAEVKRLSPTTDQKERMQRWLAAHFATVSQRQATSKSVGGMSITYETGSGEGLEKTPYGQEYKRLVSNSQKGYLRIM